MESNKRKSAIKIALIILLSIGIVLATINNILIVTTHKRIQSYRLDIIPYEHFYIPMQELDCNYTKQEVKSILDKKYKQKYTYSEANLYESHSNGFLYTAAITNIKEKTIIISSTLSIEEYIYVMSHELTHLKYKSTNETWVEYTAIIALYESGNDVFEIVALNRARQIVSGFFINTEYDCGYYLLEYFGDDIY